MVRRNELACRDEWSRSLWQPVANPKANGTMPLQFPPAASPLLPAESENLRSVLGQGADSVGNPEGEDVLLSEGRIVSEAHKPWESSERPLATTNFDPRTAIFRAREAYRERARAKAVADRQSDGAEAATRGTPQGAVAQREPGELATGVRDEASSGGTGLVADRTAEIVPDVEAAGAHSAEGDHSKPDSELRLGAEPTEQRPKGPDRAQAGEFNGINAALDGNPDPLPMLEPSDVTLTPSRTRDDSMIESWGPAVGEEVSDQDPTPAWFRTDLPRICRSCRDYRPAADGQRGWCANAWAFTHHRLVHEDDLAPCQSSIGDWWTPVDDVWLVAADVSTHGRATPLLDRLTGKLDLQRRRS
jgi:hypothetical protein